MAKELWESQSMMQEAIEEYKERFPDGTLPEGGAPYEYTTPSGKTVTLLRSYPLTIFNARFPDATSPFYLFNDRGLVSNVICGFHSQYSVPRSGKVNHIEDFRYSMSESAIQQYIDADFPDFRTMFPGLYPTRMDMNFLFGFGQEYGKRKFLGWKATFDNTFYAGFGPWSSYLRLTDYSSKPVNSNGELTGVGAVLYNEKGTRYLRCIGGNGNLTREETPEMVRESNSLKHYDATRRMIATDNHFENRKFEYFGEENLTLAVKLPRKPQNYSAQICSFKNEHDAIWIFQPKVYFPNDRRVVSGRLCDSGEMSLCLSKYSDILTNKDHAGDYIDVLHIVNRHVCPQIGIPLKGGVQYYLYLKYVNGCMEANPALADDVEMRLGAYHGYNELFWPSTNTPY